MPCRFYICKDKLNQAEFASDRIEQWLQGKTGLLKGDWLLVFVALGARGVVAWNRRTGVKAACT